MFVWASLEAPGEAQPAVAVVTGRGFRGAVSRNLAKRRLRSGILERRDLLDPGYEYLVEGRPGVEKADYQILVTEIEDLLSRTRNCVKQKRREPGEE